MQNAIMEGHENESAQIRIEPLLDHSLPYSKGQQLVDEFSVFAIDPFQGRLEVHIRLQFGRQEGQEDTKIEVLHRKLGAEIHRAIEFFKGIPLKLCHGMNHFVNVEDPELIDDLQEQLTLAAEMRIKGALGQPDFLGDVVDGCAVIPIPNEQG